LKVWWKQRADAGVYSALSCPLTLRVWAVYQYLLSDHRMLPEAHPRVPAAN